MKILNNKNDILKELDNIHLQWFGAEEEGRTEEASEHKLSKSRKEGKVSKSQDLSGAIVMICTFVTIFFTAKYILTNIADMFRYFMKEAVNISSQKTLIDKNFDLTIVSYIAKIALPVLIVSLIASILGNIIQVGFVISLKPIKPDLKRIAPDFAKYLKNKILSLEAFYNLLKSLSKVGIIGFCAYINILKAYPALMIALHENLKLMFLTLLKTISTMFLEVSIIFFMIGIIDFFFQKRTFKKSMKMTKQEVKEERKTFEGDPLIKSRLKQRMREILSQNIAKIIPQADVLVVNPTHYAIALEYKRDSMTAPKVTSKGADNFALKMKEIARENNVPIIENKYLARSLYNDVQIGDEIPEKYYEAVVIVLKEVYKIKQRKV